MLHRSTEFNLGDLATVDDPYAALRSVRAHGAVVRSDTNWLVLSYEGANTVLTSGKGRSGFIGELYRSILPPGAANDEMGNRINFLDPPRHTAIRKIISKAFTPRRISTLRPFIHDLSRELLLPLAGDSPVDLIATFTHQLPTCVISELLGVPLDERDRLTALADRVSGLLGLGGLTPEIIADATSAAEDLHAYLKDLIEECRRAPRDDLLSALIVAEDDHQRLTEGELLSLVATLYSAGHRTTRDLFSNGLSALLSNETILAEVLEEKIPIDAVVEEFLRYETPTHYVARILAEPLEVAGVEIPAGEPVAIVLASANRDPEAYPDPDRFDPLRWTREPLPPQPLSFAIGAHYCLGANLARLEAGVMLETLLETFPNIGLSEEPLRWWHSGLFRGLETLPVIPGACATTSRV